MCSTSPHNGLKIHVTRIRHIISVEQAHPSLYGGKIRCCQGKNSQKVFIWILLRNDVGVEAVRGQNVARDVPDRGVMIATRMGGRGREHLVVGQRWGDVRAMDRRERCAEKEEFSEPVVVGQS